MLEERWNREPGSRIFLQLAEELRRSGRLARAIEVLREGLVLHPGYPSALVALGRDLLENGDPLEAADVLERALGQDPTQFVATKLAVEAHLQNRDAAQARTRLDLYRLFNDYDDEISDLARRLSELERGPGTASVEPRSTETGPAAVEAAPFDWSPALATAELSFEPAARATPRRDPMPFGPLAAGDASALFALACRRDGIFAVTVSEVAVASRPDPTASAASAAPLEAEARASVLEPVAEPEPRSTLALPPVEQPETVSPAPPWGGRSRMEELEHEESAFTTPFSPREIGAEVERETIEEPFDEVFASAPASPRLPDPAGGPQSSATLGRLYLDQGHLEEAERSFRAVLDARPDDVAAARGLEEVVRRRTVSPSADEETASGWGGEAPVASARPPGSLTDRKIGVLRKYLRKIRQGARSRVS